MDKKKFFGFFDAEVDKYEIAQLYNFYMLGLKKIEVCTKKFYTINIYNIMKEICSSENIKCEFYSEFDYFERGFILLNGMDSIGCPILPIKITNKNKFKRLQHKDYLGSILGLGIERSRVGDLIVKDDSCYAVICSDLEEFLVDNLQKVGNCSVEVEVLSMNDELPKVHFDERVILISSLRLDNFVSELSGISRNKSENLISSGSVQVNYAVIKEKSKVIKYGDILTIRGNGKYIVDSTIGNSKSGKVKVVIKKFT